MITRVSEALVADAIVVQPSWTSFGATIEGLVQRLVASGHVPPGLVATAVQRVDEREAVASTAMVDIGVSIPHARLEGIGGIVAALAVAPVAVYQVADRLPISIVVLVLSSPSLTGEHLNFLAALSMLLQSAQVRDQLRAGPAADAVLQVIRRHEHTRG